MSRSSDALFLKHCFRAVERKNGPSYPNDVVDSPTKRRHYQYVIYFKSDNDSNEVSRAVIIDKDCNVKTLYFGRNPVFANHTVRELSCIRVFWDETDGFTIHMEQFHKGDTFEDTFYFDGDHTLHDSDSLTDLLHRLLSLPNTGF
jgi:hypothetical protein